MKANVFDVARYILEKEGKMSTAKLQKLCYYAQAWNLVWEDDPLFDEDFYAWENGPICKELYYKTRGKFSVIPADEPGNSSNLTPTERRNIDEVLDYYAKHNAQWLSQLTHLEEPWREARTNLDADNPLDSVITKESMAFYYGGLDEETN